MNRRGFLKGCMAGIATVAIGMHVARGMPAVLADGFEYKIVRLGFTITSEEIEDGFYGEIGDRIAKALARSMMQTKEIKAQNVLERAFGPMDEQTSRKGARRAVGERQPSPRF